MKKIINVFSAICLVLAVAGMFVSDCQAAFHLFDDKLRVKGSIYEFMIYRTSVNSQEEQYRDTDWGLMRTKGTLELLYKTVEKQDVQLNVFGFFQWWHDSVYDFDDKYHDSMARDARHRYRGPFYDQDDWINELYIDFYAGKWNIRLGKQIVFWSEVEMVRTIDRINPLDLRYTTPGVDPWDEMKLGLWMMRGFYNSDLPGQLVFEWIWIPGDYEGVRTPREGSSMGAVPGPEGPVDLRPRAFGQNASVDEMWRRSQPSFKLSNSTFAFRIRGNSEVALFGEYYLLDWTVSYYHGMNNTPVANRGTLGAPNMLNMDPTTMNGYQNNLAIRRLTGADFIRVPRDFWEYKFFDVVGASCQTYVPKMGAVVRGEVSYEIGLPENKSFPNHIENNPSYMKQIYGTTERDVINMGVTIDKPLKLNWLSQRWGASGVFDCTFGWFGQWRLGNITRIRRTFAYDDRSQTNFTLTVRTKFRNNELWPTFRMLYNTRNWGYGVLACRYTPGAHFRYELGYMWFFAHDPYNFREAKAEENDSIYFRIGYEF